MFVNRLIALSFLFVLAACATDKDPTTQDPAPVEYSDGSGVGTESDVTGGQLGELTPGSQEELVATVGDRVFFDFNSYALSDNAQKTLTRQAEWLKTNASVNVIVEGHCDERGTREYNLALGERRAKAVKDFLASAGVPSGRISIISYGKEHPEYLESNEEAWSKNRRGVTVVTN